MPSYIVKASPDEDWYVEWSTVVDAPCAWGTRAELAQHLSYEENAPARWERADKRGTSANWPGWPTDDMPFGWGDKEFILMEAGPERPGNGTWLLPRANLRAFCERIENGDERGSDTADLLRLEVYDE